MEGERETSSWTADPGSDDLPQLQSTDIAGADQGAHQARYWLPHGLQQLEERRTGGVEETVSTTRQEGAGGVLPQSETAIKLCLL